jgi:hypothetical protein
MTMHAAMQDRPMVQTHMEKYEAVKHQNVGGRFRPVKSVQVEQGVFCTVGEEKSVRVEIFVL